MPKKGDLVVCTNLTPKSVYYTENAEKFLELGKSYKISRVIETDMHTYIWVVGIPKVGFNSDFFTETTK